MSVMARKEGERSPGPSELQGSAASWPREGWAFWRCTLWCKPHLQSPLGVVGPLDVICHCASDGLSHVTGDFRFTVSRVQWKEQAPRVMLSVADVSSVAHAQALCFAALQLGPSTLA